MQGNRGMRDGTAERREAILRDAINAMIRDHGPGVGLSEVAHRIGTSPRHLQRVFAEHGAHSFRDTLAAVRMAHARRLLGTTDRPIREIASAVGYVHAAQLSKAFRQRHGVSPREYRKSRRANVPRMGPLDRHRLRETADHC
jgi:transcriptional regulator GlxA family with amidase domain